MDRDEHVPKHPRAQTATPLHVDVESSGAIEDPDVRAAWRAKQPEDKRIEKLEAKHDKLTDAHHAHVAATAGQLGHINGQLGVLVGLAEASDDERKARRQREIDDAAALESARIRRAELWRQFLKIVVPLVVAIGGIYGVYRGAR